MPKRKLSDDQLQQLLLDASSDRDRAENEDLSASCMSDSDDETEATSVLSARVFFAQSANPPPRAQPAAPRRLLQVRKQNSPGLVTYTDVYKLHNTVKTSNFRPHRNFGSSLV
jgi:hypothetical protein